MKYSVILKSLFVIILGLYPLMSDAADIYGADSPFPGSGTPFLIAKSGTSGENNNMTIVLPAKDDDLEKPEGDKEAGSEKVQGEAAVWKKGFEIETNFNTKDWMLGLGLGMQHSSGFSLLLRFQIRPLTNTVFVEKSPDVYRQYNERRMILGLSAGWDYMIAQPFGIYINAGYGVSFAYFRGSDESLENLWTPMAGGGILLKPWVSASFRFGYEYIRTPQYPDHHINISSMLMF